jgi:hypothetical protein
MASSTDNTDGGQFTDGTDGSLYGAPDVTGSASDYSGMTWQQIEAAINGGSMLPPGATGDQQRASSIASPQTLWTGGDDFYTVQMTLQMVYQSLTAQVNALAGQSDSPWQGEAATAFVGTITMFANQVQAAANVLAGGSTGLDSIPNQLVSNGNALQIAQADIEAIDTYYANVALSQGATMSNGLVQIHVFPQLVAEMTSQMLAVLMALVGSYEVTIDSVVSPSPINSPTDDGTPGDNPNIQDPDNIPAPDAGNLPTPDDTGVNTPGPLDDGSDTGVSAPPDTALAAVPSGGAGSGGVGDVGGGGLPLTSSPDGGPDAGVSAPPDTALAAVPSGGAGSGGVGDVGGGGLPLTSSPDGGPDAGVSAPPDTALAAVPSGGATDSGSASAPNLGAGVGVPLTSSLGAGTVPPDTAIAPIPSGATGADDFADTGLPSGDVGEPGVGLPTSTAVPPVTTGSALPLGAGMPLGSGAAGLPGFGDTTPTDSSGLLSGSAPFTGAPVDDEVGAPEGAGAGGVALNGVPAAGAPGTGTVSEPADTGVPFLPGSGLGAGAAPGSVGGEPTDASGLLSGSAPFTGAPVDDEVGAPEGTAFGGSELSADGVGPAQAALPGFAAVGGEVPGGAPDVSGTTGADGSDGGVPFMPGAGVGAGAQAAGGSEPTDTSGLLAEGDEAWNSGSADDETGSPSGSSAGAPAGLLGAGPEPGGEAPWFEFDEYEPGDSSDGRGPEPETQSAAASEAESGSEPEFGPEFESESESESEPAARQAATEAADPPAQPGDDPSAWEIAGVASTDALIALGLWNGRRDMPDQEHEVFARVVSVEREAWTGPEAKPDSGPEAATWRPDRTAGARALPRFDLTLRSNRAPAPPPDEPAEPAPEPDEDEETRARQITDLLVQEADLWGSARTRGDEL